MNLTMAGKCTTTVCRPFFFGGGGNEVSSREVYVSKHLAQCQSSLIVEKGNSCIVNSEDGVQTVMLST